MDTLINKKDTNNPNPVLRADGHVFHIDGKGSLLSYEGPGGEVKVPEGVLSIGIEAFAFCTQVTGVILPEGVRAIARRAFYRSGIKTIQLPASLQRIDKHAFAESSLESVEIPDQVNVIEERAFLNAKHLQKVKLPKGIITLEPGVFSGCSSLQEVILPKSLKHIEGSAFLMCTSLAHIELPEGLVSVWERAFRGCRSLREIFLGDNVEAIGHAAFEDCTALEKVRIPENLEMKHCHAFRNTGRVVFTGPGRDSGLIVADHNVRYFPASRKLVVPEGVTQSPYYALQSLREIEILDLPRELKYYSLLVLAELRSLRLIVTDRDSPMAAIALMLNLECEDRNGRKFVYKAPADPGEWIIEEDEDHNGVRIAGCRREIGYSGMEYIIFIIPDEIGGRPVTAIGREALSGYKHVDAFYIPDSVRRIESRAFARNESGGYPKKVFVRMPKRVSTAGNAFAGSVRCTKESVREDAQRKAYEEAEREREKVFRVKTWQESAVRAADDPTIGTGIEGRPELKPNIWQYLDRLGREELAEELTHSFAVSGTWDGAGWASIKIMLDGENTWFRISYVGNSAYDFREFAEEIEDGENDDFGWESEPGWYPWSIQRRGQIFYVNPPVIEKSFFIPRDAFLSALSGLTSDW